MQKSKKIRASKRANSQEYSKIYKYVRILIYPTIIKYYSNIRGGGNKSFTTEKEAAIHADKLLILSGKSPVNVLKRINN